MLHSYDIIFSMLAIYIQFILLSAKQIFEFIQARLAIAIGPSPDMASLVDDYNCGIVAKEFSVEAMADSINSLSINDIDIYKRNSHKAALVLNHEVEQQKLNSILE